MFRITQKGSIAVAAAAVAISLGAMAGSLGGNGRVDAADGAAPGTAAGGAHPRLAEQVLNASFS